MQLYFNKIYIFFRTSTSIQTLFDSSTIWVLRTFNLLGGLLRGKEGNCDLRSSATAEVLPEDPDQAGEGAGEEVLREARCVHRPEENPAQTHQEDQQVEAEEAQVGLAEIQNTF